MADQQFRWKLAVNPLIPWVATVDENLITVKTGLRTWRVPLSDLKYVYAAKGAVLGESALDAGNAALDGAVEKAGVRFVQGDADKAIASETVGEILLCHERGGKRKTVRLSVPHDGTGSLHEQPSRFIEAVIELRPNADIRAMDRKQAHELMGVVDTSKVASAIVVGIIVVIAMGIAYLAFGSPYS